MSFKQTTTPLLLAHKIEAETAALDTTTRLLMWPPVLAGMNLYPTGEKHFVDRSELRPGRINIALGQLLIRPDGSALALLLK
jgi:hypothetical protein